MKDIFPSLDKIQWHRRHGKEPSLFKLLRYKMATKDVLSGFETFLNFERVLKSFDTYLIPSEDSSDKDEASINAVLLSLEDCKLEKNQFTEDCIYLDRILDIIKCHILLQNHATVLISVFEEYSAMFQAFKPIERFQDFSKYTWRLVAEVLVCTCFIVNSNDNYSRYLRSCFIYACTAVEILFELIRFQESIIVKHIKTTSGIYEELIDLTFWACSLFVDIGCRLKFNFKDMRYSLYVLCKNITPINIDAKMLVVPIYKLRIFSYLLEWFEFDREKVEEPPKCRFNLAVTDVITPRITIMQPAFTMNPIIQDILLLLNSSINDSLHDVTNELVAHQSKHAVEMCIDILILLLSQFNQYSSVSTLCLKYLDLYFEDSNSYCLLASSFFASGHYIKALQTCHRIMEFDPSNEVARSLILNASINIFERYDDGIRFSTDFLMSDPNNPMFYHSRAICYLEKSFHAVSYAEIQDLLYLCQNDIMKAISLDDHDSELYYIASLACACLGDLDAALLHSIEASQRSLFDSRPYHMTFLVFVAKNLFDEALRVLTDMEHEFPCDFSIIINKVEIDHYLYGPETALASVKSALESWYLTFNQTFSNLELKDGRSTKHGESDDHALQNIIKGIFPRDQDANHRVNTWILNLFRGQKYSSNIVFTFSHDIKDSVVLLILLLHKMAEIYLELRNYEQMRNSIDSIHSLGYVFPEVYLIEARYHKATGNLNHCKECIETSLYLNSNHVESLHLLTLFYMEQYDGLESDKKLKSMNLELAEETARQLVKVAPRYFVSWQVLGKVLNQKNNTDESLFCYKKALELKDHTPIIPFKRIFRRMKPNDLNIKTVV